MFWIFTKKRIAPDQNQALELGNTIIQQFLPMYHVADIPSDADLELAERSWDLITTGTSLVFMEDRRDSANAASLYGTCVEYFEDIFFDSLFEIDPELRNSFVSDKGIIEVKWIYGVIHTILTSIHDESEFNKQIQRLARKNYKNGITIRDFGLIGEMLFYSLGRVLRDDYTYEIHMAWIKIFSWVLRVMVPVAVVIELNKDHALKDDRLPVYGEWSRINRQGPVKSKCRREASKLFFKKLLSRESSIHSIEEETFCSEFSSEVGISD